MTNSMLSVTQDSRNWGLTATAALGVLACCLVAGAAGGNCASFCGSCTCTSSLAIGSDASASLPAHMPATVSPQLHRTFDVILSLLLPEGQASPSCVCPGRAFCETEGSIIVPGWWVVLHMPDAAPSVLFSQLQGHKRGDRASGEVTGMEAGNFAAVVLHKVLDISEHLSAKSTLVSLPCCIAVPISKPGDEPSSRRSKRHILRTCPSSPT